MTDNVTVAIISGSAIVISAICVLGAGIFAYIASNKRLDKIDSTLLLIQNDLKEFFRRITTLEEHKK